MRSTLAAMLALSSLTVAARVRAEEAPSAAELPPPDAPPAPRPESPPLGVIVGLRGGGTFLAGSVGEPVRAAATFGLEGGVRFLSRYYGVLTVGGDFFASGKDSQRSVSGLLLGVRGGWLSNPSGLGFAVDVGAGFRRFGIGDAIGTSTSRGGLDGLVGAALTFKASDFFRLQVPRIDAAVGSAGGDVHALFTIGVLGEIDAELGKARKRSQ